MVLSRLWFISLQLLLCRERAQKSWSSSEPCSTVGTFGAVYLLRTSPTGTLGGEAVPEAQGNLLLPGMPLQVMEVEFPLYRAC